MDDTGRSHVGHFIDHIHSGIIIAGSSGFGGTLNFVAAEAQSDKYRGGEILIDPGVVRAVG